MIDFKRRQSSSSSSSSSRQQTLDHLRAVCTSVANVVQTTLGPCGQDKILIDPYDDIIAITNDGASILRHMHVVEPAGRMMIEVAVTQDEYIGDGTTSVVLLVAELMKVVGKVEALKRVVGAMPDSLLRRRFQTDSMEWPIGVIQPIPVMTTRFMVVACCELLVACGDRPRKRGR